ncbi:MAG: hypothetical protein ACE5PT_11895 [Gemmatimonadales bacterium]
MKTGRVLGMAAAFAGVEALAITVRGDDWWPSPSGRFHVETRPSPSKGQDRLLHASFSYRASKLSWFAWRWACLSETASAWLGAATGIAIGLPKEIGDGFQPDKGFDLADMGWTAAGAIIPALHRTWPETRIVLLKSNYWPSDEFLNRTGDLPQLENDYAGQRYYLAINPGRLSSGAGPWPDWLGFAVGHSVPHWISRPPVHQWYVTLDLNLRGLPIEGTWWRWAAAFLDQVHVPFPGIRIQEGEVKLGLF